jgi:hypothetical protein
MNLKVPPAEPAGGSPSSLSPLATSNAYLPVCEPWVRRFANVCFRFDPARVDHAQKEAAALAERLRPLAQELAENL